MFDLVIIGGGPAGYSAAFEAARYGLKTILFEKREVGGTCLNRGCVPTKYLSHLAKSFYDLGLLEIDGIRISEVSLNYKSSNIRMNHIIEDQRKELIEQFSTLNISYIEGEAEIVSRNKVKCGNTEFATKFILIATGSKPSEPLMSNAITSDELLALDRIPEKINILGGGTIASEFACIFRMLGSEVDVYIRADRLLRKWDKDIAVGVTHSFKKKGIVIHKNTNFGSLEISGVTLSATGRDSLLPVLSDSSLDLYDIGPDGGIVVDKYGKTKTDGVYAVGDVIEGSTQLAHIAMEQGRNAVRHMAKGNPIDILSPVKCIYLDQEIASVGYDEKSAYDAGIETVIGKTGMYNNARSLISKSDRGFVKVLAAKQDGRIIGAHLMCEHAGDIISELALAVNKGLTVQNMIESVRPHPSYCEAVTDALRNLLGKFVND